MRNIIILSIITMVVLCLCMQVNAWKPVEGHIMTPWAAKIDPNKVHQEYPRPQMVRKEWKNLNGLWDYAVTSDKSSQPSKYDGKILVPFGLESALSGVKKALKPEELLWYHNEFTIPSGWKNKLILLHFEAVDWYTIVYINGKKAGEHKGGYDPFSFDITGLLNKSKKQKIVLRVWDPSDRGNQATGKQTLKLGYIRYTPTSGIWQTVWLEPVPQASIKKLKIIPDIDNKSISIEVTPHGKAENCTVKLEALDGKKSVSKAAGSLSKPIKMKISDPKLWSPESPFLYDLKVTLLQKGKTVDSVESYFGMRKVSLEKDKNNIPRIYLNNKPYFQYGPLDQAFWPDGIYTPPSDAALKYDVQFMKDIKLNMVRVHVKIQPRRYYYYCDKIGLVVWQDMVSGRLNNNHFPDIQKDSKKQWETELANMIDNLYNYPSIIIWTPFNEGWGQYDPEGTKMIVEKVKKLDPTRLVNEASGWNDYWAGGDIKDIHDYSFNPSVPVPGVEKRAVVLGECGGINRTVPNHNWVKQTARKNKYSLTGDIRRSTFQKLTEITIGYYLWIEGIRVLKEKYGLSAFVYTQLTDIEKEKNGFLTYDRKVIKIDSEAMKNIHSRLYEPAPTFKTIVPGSIEGTEEWKYTFKKPEDNWTSLKFKDDSWKNGKGAFGTENVEGLKINTEWTKGALYLRKKFSIKELPKYPALRIYHKNVVDVYLNGKLIKSLSGQGRSGNFPKQSGILPAYVSIIPLTQDVKKIFKEGENILALYCVQGKKDSPWYVDAAMDDVAGLSTVIHDHDVLDDSAVGQPIIPNRQDDYIHLLPTAYKSTHNWKYTEKKPDKDWYEPKFNDSEWAEGQAGFGKKNTPGASVRTKWLSKNIWIRKKFKIKKNGTGKFALLIHHDEDAEVYINGKLAAKFEGFTRNYFVHPIDSKLLKDGDNTIAIFCKQTTGGQYIDAGIVRLK